MRNFLFKKRYFLVYTSFLIFYFLIIYGKIFLVFYKRNLPNAHIVIFESDDYGGPPINLELINEYEKKGYKLLPKEYKWLQNSYLTVTDLENLYKILEKHKDSRGRHPCFTANIIVSYKPDFEKIKKSNFNHYYYIPHTLNEPIVKKWREGIIRKVFYPQLHCREHFDCYKWLKDLKKGNKLILELFKKNLVSLPLVGMPSYRNVFVPKTLTDKKVWTCQVEAKVKDAVEIFYNLFGYYPSSIIAPYYGWDDISEAVWSKYNLKYIQGANYRWIGFNTNGKKIFKKHYLGERSKYGQIYLIRNCEFEPFKGNNYFYCFKQVKKAFLLGLPSIIYTHRGNYSSQGIDRNFPKKGLLELDKLLTSIEKNYPDVIYLTSPELGQLLEKSKKEVLPHYTFLKKLYLCFLQSIAAKPFNLFVKCLYSVMLSILVVWAILVFYN